MQKCILQRIGVFETYNADPTRTQSINALDKVGCIMVLDGDDLVGVFTERDVLHRVVAADLPAKTTPVAQVMTSPVESVRPDMSIDEAMTTITEKCHRHLPVMDEGKLIGLISIGDITRWLVQAHQNEAQNLWHYITGNYPS